VLNYILEDGRQGIDRLTFLFFCFSILRSFVILSCSRCKYIVIEIEFAQAKDKAGMVHILVVYIIFLFESNLILQIKKSCLFLLYCILYCFLSFHILFPNCNLLLSMLDLSKALLIHDFLQILEILHAL